MEQLLEALVGSFTPLTTAALAHIELPINSWRDLGGPEHGNLLRVWQPRELED